MKAILLCAGRGSRLDPLTVDRPKCLVEVGGAAILDHQISALHSCGIHEVVVVAGYRGEKIENHVARHPRGERISVAHNSRWAATSSIASVWAVRSMLNQPFVLVNGDTIFPPELLARALARVETEVNLLIEYGSNHSDDMRVRLNDGKIAGVGKQIDDATFRSLGIIVSTGGERYLGALTDVIASPGGEGRYHHDVIDQLASVHQVNPVAVSGMRWQEIDTIADIECFDQSLSRAA